MVVSEGAINNIMGGMENTAGVRLHSHRHKLKQRFDILKKLGQGTYGKVQLAVNKETGQEVAIKTIKKGKIETEQDLVRIRREIQIMSSVQHPQIVHIYEVFENREKMVLVMEYAAGGELYDYLSERKVLPEDEARRVFRQVSSAVYYCHKHKICHRDLKLENILLDVDGNAKIADFGLSNVFDDKHRLDTFCGSPLYASPEIVKGVPYLGPEVDCWSLGVLLYTLVYGAMPFDGSNFRRLVKQITQGDFYEPATPSNASKLIKHMLTVNASERATIDDICNHWWVNEGYRTCCLKEAEYLAKQTPVRLDLLLSLAPKQIDAEHMLIQEDVPADAAKQSVKKKKPEEGDDQTSAINEEGTSVLRSHSAGSVPPATSSSIDRLVKKKIREKATDGSREGSTAPEKKKKKKEDSGKKKKSVEPTPETESKVRIIGEMDEPVVKRKSDDDSVKEKKKTKKRDSGEIKKIKKKIEKIEEYSPPKSPISPPPKPPVSPPPKSTVSSPKKISVSPLTKESIEKIKTETSLRAKDKDVVKNPDTLSEDQTPPQILPESEELKESGTTSIEPLSPVEVKSPLDDASNTEKILLETAAKIEAVEAALEAERIANANRKDSKTIEEEKFKHRSSIGSPVSNKSSIQSSTVTSPTRSRTGSESSGDRMSSSRRQSKIFSKAAMFDNLAAQNSSRSPPPEKPKRTPKPGTLNLTDLTKKFEEKADKKNRIVTSVKVSDAKRAFENKSDKSLPQSPTSRTSSRSSDSQPTSPPSKISSPASGYQGKSTPVKSESEQVEDNVKQTPISQASATNGREISPKGDASGSPSRTKGKENVQPSRQIRAKISPTKKEQVKPGIREEKQTSRAENLSETKVRKDNSPEQTKSENSSTSKFQAEKSRSTIRQIEIKLESTDSSDSESEAERMLKTLTEKREKVEQVKAEKLRKVSEAREKEPRRDMPAIKEEPRTPTPARHVLPDNGRDVKSSTLPRGFKSKESEPMTARKSVPISPASSQGEQARKKTQMNITLNSSDSKVRAPDSQQETYTSRSSSRNSPCPEYRTEMTHNICEPSYASSSEGSLDQSKPHLQRARRERIIPIMMEYDEEESFVDKQASLTSSEASVPMYNASSKITTSIPHESQYISPERIQKSRRERIIPIAVEGEGLVTPNLMASDPSESSFRRPMHHIINQKLGRERSIIDRSDSFSSAGEDDDDDDGFQIMTAESLFSTLLGRVRSLTRKMADDPRSVRRNMQTSDGRMTAVGEPGAFWSSLHNSRGESPTGNLCREDPFSQFGMWNSSLSREPSDSESVFSEPNGPYSSLPRAEMFRHRRLIPPSVLNDPFFRTS